MRPRLAFSTHDDKLFEALTGVQGKASESMKTLICLAATSSVARGSNSEVLIGVVGAA